MALEEDLQGLEGELEEAGSAAAAFRGSLAALPSAMNATGAAAAAMGGLLQAVGSAAGAAAAQGMLAAAKEEAAAKQAAEGVKKAAAAAKEQAEKPAKDIRAAFQSAANGIKDVGKVVKTLSSGDLPTAKEAMGALGSALGGAVTSGAHQAAEALAKLGPEGAVAGAVIEGLAAVFAATIGVMTQFMGMAIEVSQKADLMRDRFAALAGGAAGGKAVQAMLANLNLPFASSEVSAWGQSLLAAGIQGKQLEADIKAVAAATALMGETGGAAAMTLFKRLGEGGPAADKLLKTFQDGGPKADKLLKEMGLSLRDLGGAAAVGKMNAQQLHEAIAKAMQKKGAGPLADMALQLPVILQKAREGFMSLFGGAGPAVKLFMTAVKKLFGEFNKGSPIIKGLKPIMTGLLTTLFGWATSAVTAIRGVVQWLTKGAKSGGIFGGAISALKAGWKALAAIFGAVSSALAPVVAWLKIVFSNAMVLKGIRTVLMLIVGTIVGVIVVFAAVAGAVAMYVGIIVGVIGTIVGSVMGVVGEVASALGGIVDAASSAASGFISGLLGGITGGAGSIIGAVMGLAGSIKSSLLGALGIHSPSKFAQGAAGNVTETFADTIEDGAPDAGRSMKKLVTPPKLTKGAEGGRGQGGGGDTFKFDNCIFNGTTQDEFSEQLAKELDKLRREGPSAGPPS